MTSVEEYSIALPLTQLAYSTANQFAAEQTNSDKAERVRLNTLAVWLVRDYLDLMGIPTNITGGDSWNPIMRMSAEVADLEVTGLGFLECIPCQTPASSYNVPPEAWGNRLGYIVVQIDDSWREGTILGFTTEVQNGIISQLQSWDSLLVHLDRLRSRVTVEETITNLSQWLEGIVQEGWETARELFSTPENNLAFGFRDRDLRRGKRLDLGNEFGSVILFVQVEETESSQKIITLELCPIGNDYLPEQVQLQILDDSDTILPGESSATSTSENNLLRLQLNGEPGERFKVQVIAGATTRQENFMI